VTSQTQISVTQSQNQQQPIVPIQQLQFAAWMFSSRRRFEWTRRPNLWPCLQ